MDENMITRIEKLERNVTFLLNQITSLSVAIAGYSDATRDIILLHEDAIENLKMELHYSKPNHSQEHK